LKFLLHNLLISIIQSQNIIKILIWFCSDFLLSCRKWLIYEWMFAYTYITNYHDFIELLYQWTWNLMICSNAWWTITFNCWRWSLLWIIFIKLLGKLETVNMWSSLIEKLAIYLPLCFRRFLMREITVHVFLVFILHHCLLFVYSHFFIELLWCFCMNCSTSFSEHFW